MGQLVKLYRESHLGKRLPAYDGRKSLYTAGPLPFVSKEFKITLIDEDDGSGVPRLFLNFMFSFNIRITDLFICCYVSSICFLEIQKKRKDKR